MATISLNAPQRIFGGTPYGNHTVHKYAIETAANGSVIGSDVATGVAIADKIRLGKIPVGFELHDSLMLVSVGMTATITGKLGFEYVDGVDDTADAAAKDGRTLVLQDDDYFGTGITLATAGRYRASNTAVRPVTLPKDAYLILTTAVAANAKASAVDVLLYGVDRGPL